MNPNAKFKGAEIAQIIKEARENFLLHQEMFAVIASELKAKYDALIDAGFSPQQALELCKSKSI